MMHRLNVANSILLLWICLIFLSVDTCIMLQLRLRGRLLFSPSWPPGIKKKWMRSYSRESASLNEPSGNYYRHSMVCYRDTKLLLIFYMIRVSKTRKITPHKVSDLLRMMCFCIAEVYIHVHVWIAIAYVIIHMFFLDRKGVAVFYFCV